MQLLANQQHIVFGELTYMGKRTLIPSLWYYAPFVGFGRVNTSDRLDRVWAGFTNAIRSSNIDFRSDIWEDHEIVLATMEEAEAASAAFIKRYGESE